MSNIVRLEALHALALLIAAAIPELAGHICEGIAPSSEHEEVPNLSINFGRWLWEPEQEAEHAVLPGNVVVFNVGQHTTPMVMSILAANSEQRADLEDRILDLFRNSTHPLTGMPRPGVLVVPVTSCEQLRQWVATFELDTDEWVDTDALSRRYESRIVAQAIIPALTVRRAVYTIRELKLGIAPLSGATITTEVVSIAQDGTLTPSTF